LSGTLRCGREGSFNQLDLAEHERRFLRHSREPSFLQVLPGEIGPLAQEAELSEIDFDPAARNTELMGSGRLAIASASRR
jgi:hypothetical protein